MLKTLPRSKTPSGAAYLERGEGDETLVLIHGVGMRIEAWQPQIDRLANDVRVVAVDLPGHGFSDALAGAQPHQRPGHGVQRWPMVALE